MQHKANLQSDSKMTATAGLTGESPTKSFCRGVLSTVCTYIFVDLCLVQVVLRDPFLENLPTKRVGFNLSSHSEKGVK